MLLILMLAIAAIALFPRFSLASDAVLCVGLIGALVLIALVLRRFDLV